MVFQLPVSNRHRQSKGPTEHVAFPTLLSFRIGRRPAIALLCNHMAEIRRYLAVVTGEFLIEVSLVAVCRLSRQLLTLGGLAFVLLDLCFEINHHASPRNTCTAV